MRSFLTFRALGFVAVFSAITFPVWAAVPPSFYLAEKLAKRRGGLEGAIVQYEIFKPAAEKDKGPATFLWRGTFVYVPGRVSPERSTKVSYWPLAELLLEPDSGRLLNSWKNFGLPVAREEELVIKRGRGEKHPASEEENSFYRRENSLAVKRYENKIAWQIAEAAGKKRLLIEKDSFDLVAMVGPCPTDLAAVFVGSAKESPECTLEFRYGNNENALQTPASVWLKIGGHDFAFLRINRIVSNPGDKPLKEALKANSAETLATADEAAKAFVQAFLL